MELLGHELFESRQKSNSQVRNLVSGTLPPSKCGQRQIEPVGGRLLLPRIASDKYCQLFTGGIADPMGLPDLHNRQCANTLWN